jgi:hypothetical protein
MTPRCAIFWLKCRGGSAMTGPTLCAYPSLNPVIHAIDHEVSVSRVIPVQGARAQSGIAFLVFIGTGRGFARGRYYLAIRFGQKERGPDLHQGLRMGCREEDSNLRRGSLSVRSSVADCVASSS